MTSMSGQLLVAGAQLGDSFFFRSVILILAHSDEGAAGLIINRTTEATVSDLSESIFPEAFAWDKPISLGGPVSGPLVLLHRHAEFADHEVVAGVYSTVEEGKVRDVLRERVEPSVVAINYSGWGPGQLERELRDDSWEVLAATAELVFPPAGTDLWGEATRQVQERKLRALVGLRGVPRDPTWN